MFWQILTYAAWFAFGCLGGAFAMVIFYDWVNTQSMVDLANQIDPEDNSNDDTERNPQAG